MPIPLNRTTDDDLGLSIILSVANIANPLAGNTVSFVEGGDSILTTSSVL
jgi:hypothetical protein